MNKNPEEQLHILTNLTMSAIEKTEIRDSLVRFISAHPVETVSQKSWFKNTELLSSPYTGIHKSLSRTLVFSLLGLISLGGSLTYASSDAIPGEMLYPIKINIKESLEGTFKTTPEIKLAWKEEKVARRIEEIKTLQKKPSLTKRETAIAQAVLKEHIEDLKKTLVELKNNGNEGMVLASAAQLIPKTEKSSQTKDVQTAILKHTNLEEKEEDLLIDKKITAPAEVSEVSTTSLQKDVEILSLEDVKEGDNTGLKDVLSQEVERQVETIKKTVADTVSENENKTKIEDTKKENTKEIETKEQTKKEIELQSTNTPNKNSEIKLLDRKNMLDVSNMKLKPALKK